MLTTWNDIDYHWSSPSLSSSAAPYHDPLLHSHLRRFLGNFNELPPFPHVPPSRECGSAFWYALPVQYSTLLIRLFWRSDLPYDAHMPRKRLRTTALKTLGWCIGGPQTKRVALAWLQELQEYWDTLPSDKQRNLMLNSAHVLRRQDRQAKRRRVKEEEEEEKKEEEEEEHNEREGGEDVPQAMVRWDVWRAMERKKAQDAWKASQMARQQRTEPKRAEDTRSKACGSLHAVHTEVERDCEAEEEKQAQAAEQERAKAAAEEKAEVAEVQDVSKGHGDVATMQKDGARGTVLLERSAARTAALQSLMDAFTAFTAAFREPDAAEEGLDGGAEAEVKQLRLRVAELEKEAAELRKQQPLVDRMKELLMIHHAHV